MAVALRRQLARLPVGKQRLEAAHHPRDRALRQMRRAQERLQRCADAPAVHPSQVTAQNRVIHLAGASRIRWEQRAPKLRRRAVGGDHPPARHGDHPQPVPGGQPTLDRPMAIASPGVGAFMPPRPKRRRQFFIQGHFDGLANLDAQLTLDLLTKHKNRAGLRAILLHGVPPSPFVTAFCLVSRRLRHFSFSTRVGTDPP